MLSFTYGVWNLFKEIATTEQRQEILDWYHLKENLYRVGGSRKRIRQTVLLGLLAYTIAIGGPSLNVLITGLKNRELNLYRLS